MCGTIVCSKVSETWQPTNNSRTTLQQDGVSVALVVEVKPSPTAAGPNIAATSLAGVGDGGSTQGLTPTESASTISLDSQSSLTAAAVSLPSPPAESGTMTHFITVAPDQYLTFAPPLVNANVGDVVELIFRPSNHSLTESSADKPCEYLPGGFRSGFNQFHAPNTTDMTLSFSVNSPEPRYFFCEQEKPESHCELGMVFAINPGPSFGAFMSAAVAKGPLSNLVTTAGTVEVTLTVATGTVTTTLTDAVIPTTILPELEVDSPSIFLPSAIGINSEVSSLQSSAATVGAPFGRRMRV